MRLLNVASATLSLVLFFAPALRAQDDAPKSKPDAEKKDDDKKKDDKKDDKKKDEKGDEGDDDDDKPKKPEERLPFNPFAKAKKGDWSVCVGKMKVTMAGGGQGGMQIPDQKIKITMTVTDVTADEVTVSMKESGGMGNNQNKKVTFSLKENPTFTKFFNGDDTPRGDSPSDWKCEDDKKTIGEKEFTCKKFSAKLKEKGAMGMDAKISLWVSDQTKGWGLLALTLKGSSQGGNGMPGTSITMDMEVKGYGNGDTADFGKKPEDAKAAGDDDGDDEDAPKSKDKDDKRKGDDAPKKDAPKKDDDKKKDD